MKKSLIKILCFIFILCSILLTGCGDSEPIREGKVNIRKVINIELEAMNTEESLSMINYMAGGRALVCADKLYSLEFTEDFGPCLAAYTIGENGLSDYTVLAEECVPEFLCKSGEKLYYINSAAGGNIESIATDGSDRKTIKEGPSDFLRVEDDKLYYCDAEKRFCKSGTEGSGEEIIMPESCCYPYIIGDKLLYQKARNEHLYLYNFTDGSDMEITDIPSYGPVIIKDRLYCRVTDGIYSTDLQGLEPLKYELYGIQGEVQYKILDEGVQISGVTGTEGVHSFSFNTADVKESFSKTPGGGYRICEYRDEGCAVYTDFEPTGRIKNFVFENSEGGEISFIKGEIR